MKPTRYPLPQHCSDDNLRGRRLTLERMRGDFDLKFEDDAGELTALAGHAREGHRLPPYLQAEELPKSAAFGTSKYARLATHKLRAKVNGWVQKATLLDRKCTREASYRAASSLIGGPPPRIAEHWREDAAFGRARLQGVNPMQIRHADTLGRPMDDALVAAARELLVDRGESWAHHKDRLFVCDYSALIQSEIQSQVKEGLSLAAPTAVFAVDPQQRLMPLAIRLMPADWSGENPVYTPQQDPIRWLFARGHCQAADAHFHEGTWHLGETHLVSETIAICAYRQLHADHPISQLLAPHFEYNLAIDWTARHNLMTVGGPIDSVLASGIGGALDLARGLYNTGWDYRERVLQQDLRSRGLDDLDSLPVYPYRDDALPLHKATDRYVRAMLPTLYASDEEVRGDFELQAWLHEVSVRAALPGFPAGVQTVDELAFVCREVIFRASVQHAEVNNGQYDSYGWIPFAPGSLTSLHLAPDAELQELLAMMPDLASTLAQIGMTWVLSEPTHRSILGAGDSPAFSAQQNERASRAVEGYRRELRGIAAEIERRNRGLEVPYTYLNPYNVARSTGT